MLQQYAIAFLLAGVALVLGIALLIRVAPTVPVPVSVPEFELTPVGKPFVDPWDMQCELMRASDQALPRLPAVSHGSLLYFALILEELAETGRALSPAFVRTFSDTTDETMILNQVKGICGRLEETSTILKSLLKGMPDFSYPLTEAEAVELLDGITDVQVVNSGFALASGMPAQDAYLEVVSSNLSKSNPVTGRIDKTADGKWIKGTSYTMPDLKRVLQEHINRVRLTSRNDD